MAWAGKAPVQSDPDFVTFVDAHHGIRAGARNLLTYYRKYKLATVPAIVARWAPPEDDNDTAAYISSVCGDLGVTADTKLDLEDPDVLASLVTAMVRVECGLVPYPPEQVRAAVEAAYSGGVGTGGGSQAPVPVPLPAAPRPPPPPWPGGERPVPPLVDQPSGKPTRKVQAIPLGGLAGVPVAWLAKALWDHWMPHQPMDPMVAIGIAGFVSTVGAYLAAYLTRNRASTPAVPDRGYPEYGYAHAPRDGPPHAAPDGYAYDDYRY